MSKKSDIDFVISAHTEGLNEVRNTLRSLSGAMEGVAKGVEAQTKAMTDVMSKLAESIGVASAATKKASKGVAASAGVYTKTNAAIATMTNNLEKVIRTYGALPEASKKPLETLQQEFDSIRKSLSSVDDSNIEELNNATKRWAHSLADAKTKLAQVNNEQKAVKKSPQKAEDVKANVSRYIFDKDAFKMGMKLPFDADVSMLEKGLDALRVKLEAFGSIKVPEVFKELRVAQALLMEQIGKSDEGAEKAFKEYKLQLELANASLNAHLKKVVELETLQNKAAAAVGNAKRQTESLVVTLSKLDGSKKHIDNLWRSFSKLEKEAKSGTLTQESLNNALEDFKDYVSHSRVVAGTLRDSSKEAKELAANTEKVRVATNKTRATVVKFRNDLKELEGSGDISKASTAALAQFKKDTRGVFSQEKLTKATETFASTMEGLKRDAKKLAATNKESEDQAKAAYSATVALGKAQASLKGFELKADGLDYGDTLDRATAAFKELRKALRKTRITQEDLTKANDTYSAKMRELGLELSEMRTKQKEAAAEKQRLEKIDEKIAGSLYRQKEALDKLIHSYSKVKGSEDIVSGLEKAYSRLEKTLSSGAKTENEVTQALQEYGTELNRLARAKDNLTASNKESEAQYKATHTAVIALANAESKLRAFELKSSALGGDKGKVVDPAADAFGKLSETLSKPDIKQEEVTKAVAEYNAKMKELGVTAEEIKKKQTAVAAELQKAEKLHKSVADKIHSTREALDKLVHTYSKVEGSDDIVYELIAAHEKLKKELQASRSEEGISAALKAYETEVNNIARAKDTLAEANKRQAQSERVQANVTDTVATKLHNSSKAIEDLKHRYKSIEGAEEYIKRLDRAHANLAASLSREGISGKEVTEVYRRYEKEIQKITHSVNDLKKTQQEGNVMLRNVAKEVSFVEREYSRLGKTTENLSELKNAADAYYEAVDKHGKGSAQAGAALGSFNSQLKEHKDKLKDVRDPIGEFNSKMTEVSATAQLIYGPLSGVASRITAFAGVARRTSIAVAGLIASLASLAGSATFMVRFGSEQELILKQFEHQLLLTKRATEETAKSMAKNMDRIAKSLAIDTLTSTHEARQAIGNILSFSTITTEEVTRIAKASQDMAHVTGNTLVESAKRLAKALESPGEVIEGLSDIGITFTETEKLMLKQMTLTGEGFEARNYILQQIEERMKGVAEAAASGTLAGAFDTVVERFNHLFAAAADTSGVLKSFSGVLGSIDNILKDALESAEKGEGVLVAFGKILGFIGDVLNGIISAIGLVIGQIDKLAITAGVIAAMTIAFNGYSAAIGLTLIAITALNRGMLLFDKILKGSLLLKGSIGVAILGAAAVFDIFSSKSKEASESVEDLSNNIAKLGKGGISYTQAKGLLPFTEERIEQLRAQLMSLKTMDIVTLNEFPNETNPLQPSVSDNSLQSSTEEIRRELNLQMRAREEFTQAIEESEKSIKTAIKGIIELTSEYSKSVKEARNYSMNNTVLTELQEKFNFSLEGSIGSMGEFRTLLSSTGLFKTEEDFKDFIETLRTFAFELANNSPFERAKRNLNNLRMELAKVSNDSTLQISLGQIKEDYDTSILARELYNSLAGDITKTAELRDILGITGEVTLDEIEKAITRIKGKITFHDLLQKARESALEYATSLKDVGRIVAAESALAAAQAKASAAAFMTGLASLTREQKQEIQDALGIKNLDEDTLIEYFTRLKKEAKLKESTESVKSFMQTLRELNIDLAKSFGTKQEIEVVFTLEQENMKEEAARQAAEFMRSFSVATQSQQRSLAEQMGLAVGAVNTSSVAKYFFDTRSVIAARNEIQSFTSSLQTHETELAALGVAYAYTTKQLERITVAEEKAAAVSRVEAAYTVRKTEIENKYAEALRQSEIGLRGVVEQHKQLSNLSYSDRGLRGLEAASKAMQLLQGMSLEAVNEVLNTSFTNMADATADLERRLLAISAAGDMAGARKGLVEYIGLLNDASKQADLNSFQGIMPNEITTDGKTSERLLFELELYQEQEEQIQSIAEALRQKGIAVTTEQQNLIKGVIKENKIRSMTGDIIREISEVSMSSTQREIADIDRVYQERLKLLEATGQLEEQRANLEGWYMDQKMRATDQLYSYLKDADRDWADSLADTLLDSEKNFADFTRNIAMHIAKLAISDKLTTLFNAAKTFFPSLTTPEGSTSTKNLTNTKNPVTLPPYYEQADTFAKHGRVFNGDITPFAKGGAFTNTIVNKPTTFPFASGIGLMGEAGAEAIMPLTRLSGGDLGVKAIGAGGGDVTVQIIDQRGSGSAPEVQRSQGADGREIIKVLIRDEVNSMVNSGAMDKTMAANYGVRRQGFRR